jgi:hypothetical protein
MQATKRRIAFLQQGVVEWRLVLVACHATEGRDADAADHGIASDTTDRLEASQNEGSVTGRRRYPRPHVRLSARGRGIYRMAMPAQPTEWTVEMVRALPNDGNRYEVLGGELFVTPEPLVIDLPRYFARVWGESLT